MKADKVGMANSVEIREPFLDTQLVNWVSNLPASVKVGTLTKRFETKRLLRRFCENKIPNPILARKKKGFPVPAYGLLKRGLGNWVEERIFDDASSLSNYFEKEHFRSTFVDAKKGDLSASRKIWNLIILDFWMERWLKN